ncbi:winged helix-turn-helix domain-containing protein [Telmatospirillum siberiense]|uniref:OmpR/PhoB-type domain-containing protein n=1 Tax=Telmatospirillum siberiense TaxID=382514 RepID=A0A2N3PVZ2_9PROT|nr:winged helix-turn-helix domain-containing protein [Telmatospirillum siberiense]PKU24583.1 hypothetical protein CWS72_10815 [Telmatospirillum siberiense]
MTATLLLGFSGEKIIGDYPEHFRRDGFVVRLSLGRFLGAAIREGRFDAAVLLADRPASISTLLAPAMPGDRPVICLTPASREEEIALLEAGVSLCLPADAAPAVLSLWMRHLLALAGRVRPAGFEFDPLARRARYEGMELPLRPIEFDILLYLARQAGHPCDAHDLLRRFWPGRSSSPQRLAVTMHGVRSVLAAVGAGAFLRTVPGMGYLFSSDGVVASRHRPSDLRGGRGEKGRAS